MSRLTRVKFGLKEQTDTIQPMWAIEEYAKILRNWV